MRVRNLLLIGIAGILSIISLVGISSALATVGGVTVCPYAITYAPVTAVTTLNFSNQFLNASNIAIGFSGTNPSGQANLELGYYNSKLGYYVPFGGASLGAGQSYIFTPPSASQNSNTYEVSVSKTSGTAYVNVQGTAYSPLASKTVYVGQNISSGSFKVQVVGISLPNESGVSAAAMEVYFTSLTNVSQKYPGQIENINLPGGNLAIYVNQTWAGLYAYQKWAKLELFNQLTPVATVYVNQNLTAGPYTVQLADLGQPEANGTVPAGIDVYYNGALTNVTEVLPGQLVSFNVSGNMLYVDVNQTFAGSFAYQKYAKIQLLSQIVPTTIVYLGQNVTAGPFTVQLADLGQPNSGGWSSALLDVYYSNTTYAQIAPGFVQEFSFNHNNIYVGVNQTFAGLYAYQKYAKVELYSNYITGPETTLTYAVNQTQPM